MFLETRYFISLRELIKWDLLLNFLFWIDLSLQKSAVDHCLYVLCPIRNVDIGA